MTRKLHVACVGVCWGMCSLSIPERKEGQSQCFGIHFSPEDPLVVVVGYMAAARGGCIIQQARGGGEQIEDI